MESIFSGYDIIKLEINTRKMSEKSLNLKLSKPFPPDKDFKRNLKSLNYKKIKVPNFKI